MEERILEVLEVIVLVIAICCAVFLLAEIAWFVAFFGIRLIWVIYSELKGKKIEKKLKNLGKENNKE